MTNKNKDQSRTFFEVIKDTYFKYEEFDFLKIKAIRFPIIFSLLFFSIFWNGAKSPDFENAPRNITIGKYYCPLVGGRGYGNAKIDDDVYYHDWSKVFGFWHRAWSCDNALHNTIVRAEWIQHKEKRVLTALLHPVTERALPGHSLQLLSLKESSTSFFGVYLLKLIAFLIAAILLVKTNLSNIGNNK